MAASAEGASQGAEGGLTEVYWFGLATVKADGNGFGVLVFFGMAGSDANPILVKGRIC
jgi:hypothetical protein